jgi:DNA repair protein RadC
MDASAAIVVHQHPSGDPTASASDLAVTKKLTEAGEIVGIALLDHLIVVPGGAWRSCTT